MEGEAEADAQPLLNHLGHEQDRDGQDERDPEALLEVGQVVAVVVVGGVGLGSMGGMGCVGGGMVGMSGMSGMGRVVVAGVSVMFLARLFLAARFMMVVLVGRS
ncbi:MAG: hypothetical protein H5U05_09265 [Candidatus Aminicenantes bacterium]|nr:hypothetical protein [Candidatus Aminicenantes bacterium]